MDRRDLIRNMIIATGGIITLPQWMLSCGLSDSNIHQTSFSTEEQNLLAAVADTIIPAGDEVGALSVGVDKFLLKLFDDCYEKEVQDNIKNQLKQLDTQARKTYQRSYNDCDKTGRQELLLKFSDSGDKSEKDFFDLVKSETIRGFNTSQKVMEEFLGYRVAPGHYYGCIDLNS